MRFPYLASPSRQQLFPLGGATIRYAPVFSVSLFNASSTWSIDGLLDSGASDTVFPDVFAHRLGIDLTQAPVGQSRHAGGGVLSYRYARVSFHLSDGKETCQWEAVVGFLTNPGMSRALLGQAGFLQFFDATLCGADHEVILTPNHSFTGQHTGP